MRFQHAMSARAVLLTFLLVLAAAPAAQARPSARALLSSCERGLADADRAAVFEGQMRRVPGASRMQMRFTLQARTPGESRYGALNAPGFGSWVSSAPGTSRYVYTKRVENLLAPASYRVVLRFRWLDEDGDVVARAKRYSPVCRQPDPRPDLAVRSIGVQAADRPSRNRYVVFVRNAGHSVAEATSLLVTVDGATLPRAAVAELEPGEGVLVSLEGPACRAGAPVEAVADADDAVDERDETDNELSRAC
jgi:hypothetical protein